MPRVSSAEKLFQQGMLYQSGEFGTEIDDSKARECLLQAAEMDHAEAQYELAFMMMENEVEVDEAMDWLEKSASLGFGPAQYYYASQLESPEEEIDKLFKDAVRWYEERAKAGDAKMQYELAEIHLSGTYKFANPAEGLRWLKASAEQDYRLACRRLGNDYLRAQITKQNTNEAIYWLARAADLNDVLSCKTLGDLYLFGHDDGETFDRQGKLSASRVKPDKKKAVEWYVRGIEIGDHYMAYRLGRIYLLGHYLDQDLQQAERWLLHAATAPSGYVGAQLLLGKEYVSGKRLKQNSIAAIHWLTLAAANTGEAKLLLGEIYRTGKIVPKEPAEALKWLKIAADSDANYIRISAMKSLGLMYANGDIGSIDKATAQMWFDKIIGICNDQLGKNHRNPSVYSFTLADLYDHGIGVDQNDKMAFYWYKQAARKGHRRAMCNLGLMYHKGRGVKKDEKWAAAWLKLAAKDLIKSFYYSCE